MANHRSFTDDQLIAILPSALSWSDLQRKLGFTKFSGTRQQTLIRRCDALNLNTSHLLGQRWRINERALAKKVDIGSYRKERLRDAAPMYVAACLTHAGWTVSWPMEPARYDLLAVNTTDTLKIQVKSTTTKDRKSGSWTVRIKRTRYVANSMHTASGNYKQVKYDAGDVDIFAIVTGDYSLYMIPSTIISPIINLDNKYRDFQISPPWKQAGVV